MKLFPRARTIRVDTERDGVPARIVVTWRMTRRTRRILQVLLADDANVSMCPPGLRAAGISGLSLTRAAGVAPGKVTLVLVRLENAGLVSAEWERRADDRLRHRLYRLTADGREWAREALRLSGQKPEGSL